MSPHWRVTVRPKPVASVEVRPATARIEVNQAIPLEAVLRAADGTVLTGRLVTWRSDDAAVATGLATGPHLDYEVRRHCRPIDPESAAVEANISTELPFSPLWSAEREHLSHLLSRTPRALQHRP